MAISVGSVSVDVVPDATRFASDLKAKLANLSVDVGLNPLADKFRADMDALLRPRDTTVNVNADTTAAEAQIDAVARDRSSDVRVNAFGLGQASGGLSGLTAAALALGPALIPITAAVGGLAAALGAPIAAATGGVTVFGFVAGFAAKKTLEQQKNIDKLSTKLSGLKAGTAEYTQTQIALKVAQDALTPSQNKFLDGLAHMKDAFTKLTTTAGPVIFGPLIQSLGILTAILPKLAPLLDAVSSAFSDVLGGIARSVKGGAFDSFIGFLSRTSGPAIRGFAKILGNLAVGFGGLIRASSPLGRTLVRSLIGLTASFANFGRNAGKNGFQKFLGYIRDVGPKVATFFGHLLGALAKIATVLAPLGGVVLGLMDAFAQLIANATPKQLAAIALGVGAIGIAVTIATGGLNLLVPSLLALGAGLVYAYQHSTKFRDIVQSVGGFLKNDLLPGLQAFVEGVGAGLRGAFDNISASIQRNHGFFSVLGDVFKTIAEFLVQKALPALGSFYKVYIPLIGKAIGNAIDFLSDLALAFVDMSRFAVDSMKFLLTIVLDVFDGILHAADFGLGWLPGIGDKIHNAVVGFDQFKEGAIASLNRVSDKLKAVHDQITGLPPKTSLGLTVDVKYIGVDALSHALGLDGAPLPNQAGSLGDLFPGTAGGGGHHRHHRTSVPTPSSPSGPSTPQRSTTNQYIHNGDVVAPDPSKYVEWQRRRSQRRSLGGVPIGAT